MNCTTAVNSLCTQCPSGSYLDISGSNANYPICTICPTYCSTCTSATLCTACTPSTSYILVNTTGNINCVTLSSINCSKAVASLCTACP